jgi:ABC-type glycerol-3-phosphate transport system substrate-binding protein
MSITRWSPNKQAAYDLASYVASAASQKMLFEDAGSFPNRTDVDIAPDDPVAAKIYDWTKQYKTYADQSTLIRPKVEGVFDKAIPQIITGQKSYSDFADQLVAEQEKAAAH